MSSQASIPCGSESAQGNINGVDRLSSLPDELLHHMMSFLPMPEVVRTSVLSPRWRNLWASTPFVHIDQQDFKDENKPLGLDEDFIILIKCQEAQDFKDEDYLFGVDEDKLEKFGNHLLLLRDGDVSLGEARISVTDDSRIKSSVWIRHAIKHKVRFLHASGFISRPMLDGTSMFPSQHLERIRLQSLLLKHGFLRPVNSDCPVLENLELVNCSLWDPEEISSRSLKVLRIICCFIRKGLLICTSNLTHLSILDPGCEYGAIVTRDLSSIVAASVVLSSDKFHCYFDTKLVDSHDLLDGLSHATTLELHAPLHELAFESGLQTCPMFSNLTTLELGDWCTAADFYPLLRILHRSPKLKELSVKLEMEECSTCNDSESALSSSRGISLGAGSYPSIERIKICCFKDDPRVGALVQALLPIIMPDGKICIECWPMYWRRWQNLREELVTLTASD